MHINDGIVITAIPYLVPYTLELYSVKQSNQYMRAAGSHHGSKLWVPGLVSFSLLFSALIFFFSNLASFPVALGSISSNICTRIHTHLIQHLHTHTHTSHPTSTHTFHPTSAHMYTHTSSNISHTYRHMHISIHTSRTHTHTYQFLLLLKVLPFPLELSPLHLPPLLLLHPITTTTHPSLHACRGTMYAVNIKHQQQSHRWHYIRT